MESKYEVSHNGKVLKTVNARNVKEAVMKAMATGLGGLAFKELTAEKVL